MSIYTRHYHYYMLCTEHTPCITGIQPVCLRSTTHSVMSTRYVGQVGGRFNFTQHFVRPKVIIKAPAQI